MAGLISYPNGGLTMPGPSRPAFAALLAIKRYREITGIDLAHARQVIDNL